MITTLDLVDDTAIPRRFFGGWQGCVGNPVRGFDSVAADLSDKVISDLAMPGEQQVPIAAICCSRFEAKPERVRA